MLDIQDGACEPDIVMKRFIDFIKNKDPTKFRSTIGILGPACSDTVEPIAGVSKHFKTVVISYRWRNIQINRRIVSWTC